MRFFVEAGTYRGDTIAYLASHARRLISVELDTELFTAPERRFRSAPDVEVRLGDALDEIPEIVGSLSSPALIWLDGHFSGPGTASGNGAEAAAAVL
jgi:hypothetical protein